MKALISINFYLQAVIIATCLVAVIEPELLVLEALALGVTQMIFSLMFLIVRGNKSKLKGHFFAATIYLGSLYLGLFNQPFGLQFHIDGKDLLFWVVPALLCCYYWYQTFVHLNPFRIFNHHVLDL